MAVWKSVEYIEVEITASTEPVTSNLSKSQAFAKCVPFYTHRYADDVLSENTERSAQIEFIDNSGTAAIRITNTALQETGNVTFGVFVVEFDSTINVNSYAFSMANAVLTDAVTITNVGAQVDAFMIASYFSDDTPASDPRAVACRLDFTTTSTTEITVTRFNGDGAITGTIFVVDCDSSEFIVDHREISPASGDETATDTISATVLADSFLITSYDTSEAQGSQMDDYIWTAVLTDTTTVTVARTNGGSAAGSSILNVQVIECQANEWDVQRNTALTLGSASVTDSITSINEDRSFISFGGSMAFPQGRNNSSTETDVDDITVTADFSDNSNVRFQMRVATITNSIVAYEVVQFQEQGPVILVPTGPWR